MGPPCLWAPPGHGPLGHTVSVGTQAGRGKALEAGGHSGMAFGQDLFVEQAIRARPSPQDSGPASGAECLGPWMGKSEVKSMMVLLGSN